MSLRASVVRQPYNQKLPSVILHNVEGELCMPHGPDSSSLCSTRPRPWWTWHAKGFPDTTYPFSTVSCSSFTLPHCPSPIQWLLFQGSLIATTAWPLPSATSAHTHFFKRPTACLFHSFWLSDSTHPVSSLLRAPVIPKTVSLSNVGVVFHIVRTSLGWGHPHPL